MLLSYEHSYLSISISSASFIELGCATVYLAIGGHSG